MGASAGSDGIIIASISEGGGAIAGRWGAIACFFFCRRTINLLLQMAVYQEDQQTETKGHLFYESIRQS